METCSPGSQNPVSPTNKPVSTNWKNEIPDSPNTILPNPVRQINFPFYSEGVYNTLLTLM